MAVGEPLTPDDALPASGKRVRDYERATQVECEVYENDNGHTRWRCDVRYLGQNAHDEVDDLKDVFFKGGVLGHAGREGVPGETQGTVEAAFDEGACVLMEFADGTKLTHQDLRCVAPPLHDNELAGRVRDAAASTRRGNIKDINVSGRVAVMPEDRWHDIMVALPDDGRTAPEGVP